MSKIDDVTRLRHILDATTEACEMISGKTRNSLDTDRTLSLALVKLTEIVGEAAANVSKEKQNELSQVPWRDVISMRNRLIHAYFDVDLHIVWQTVTEDLPLLVEALRIIR
ncbi:MAG: DUF86 domain-containing protein [Plectolyngbya sp. WJT66-NPBG17]|jgi:uncharacterized protein with HEPN domain|nr:DUF86 domain-containing protein [Plectolyngbya sp. WJT66-NPBG17]